MHIFNYKKVHSDEDAIVNAAGKTGLGARPEIRFLGGGTSLIDLMKLDVETPKLIVDLNALSHDKIERTSDGGLVIGAGVKNSDLANDERVKKLYPTLSQAILAGASAQLRNKATTAGNLLQRTRCVYFRESSKACNKREPGSGCAAIHGMNRNLAILGTSESCIATNPSDMNVALRALEAKVLVKSLKGEREIAIADFHLVPGSTPEKETSLEPGDLIVGVKLAPPPDGSRSTYVKLRDRASYEFALASAAVIVKMNSGKIEHARIAMGGVGTKPWRVESAEKMLEGALPSEEIFKNAIDEFLKGAKPQTENGFKIELAKRCLLSALKSVTVKGA